MPLIPPQPEVQALALKIQDSADILNKSVFVSFDSLSRIVVFRTDDFSIQCWRVIAGPRFLFVPRFLSGKPYGIEIRSDDIWLYSWDFISCVGRQSVLLNAGEAFIASAQPLLAYI